MEICHLCSARSEPSIIEWLAKDAYNNIVFSFDVEHGLFAVSQEHETQIVDRHFSASEFRQLIAELTALADKHDPPQK